MKRFGLTLILLLALVGLAHAQTSTQQTAQRLDAATFAVHSHTSAATISIAPPAGNYVYITALDISVCGNGGTVTAAAPGYITTTNITGSPQYQVGLGATGGTCQPSITPAWTVPLKSTVAGTPVTFVLPTFATGQVISVNVYGYYNNL